MSNVFTSSCISHFPLLSLFSSPFVHFSLHFPPPCSLPPPSDLVLYRFLKGHKFHQETAGKFLRECLEFRKTHNLDSIRSNFPSLPASSYPHVTSVLSVHPHVILHGHDRRGQPLSVERLGYTNPEMMIKTVPYSRMFEYHCYHMEGKSSLVDRLSHRTGKVVRTVKIMDLSGLGRQHLNRKGLLYFKKLIDISQRNYPEMLGTLYVVNTPWIFSLGWSIVKPWLNEKTLEKIHVLGSDYLQVLEKNIEPRFIPSFLGGECTCGGTGCVPIRDPDEGMNKLIVPARGKSEQNVRVEEEEWKRWKERRGDRGSVSSSSSSLSPSGSVSPSSPSSSSTSSSSGAFLGARITLIFRTISNDINLTVSFTPLSSASSSPIILLPSTRYQSDEQQIEWSYILQESGVITLLFDNNFSWFASKTVLWRTEIVPVYEGEKCMTDMVNGKDELCDEEEVRLIDPDVESQLAEEERNHPGENGK